MLLNRLAAAAAVGLAFGAVLLASPAQADDGYYPEAGWLVQDTTIGADVDWSDCEPGPLRVDAALSAIVDSTHVGLTTLSVPAPPHYGTSVETTNLGLPVSVGDKVSVDFSLIEGASAAGGAVRLFVYSSPGADTDCTAPAVFVAAAADATSGTLTVEVPFDGEIGTLGMVYDSSNGGVGGTVRFSNLTVAEQAVSFTAPYTEPTPTPTVEPSPSPTPDEDLPAPGVGGGADDEALPTTGASYLPVIGIGGAAAIVLGAIGLLLLRRKRITFTA